jgi:hypothetical protein
LSSTLRPFLLFPTLSAYQHREKEGEKLSIPAPYQLEIREASERAIATPIVNEACNLKVTKEGDTL